MHGYQRSGEMNRSLIEANSLIDNRIELSSQVWEVMAATGTEQQSANEAAKALVGVGFDLRNNFKDTLEVMVEMRDGLGVSYENSAQMARIFEVNLKTPVREVADQIALIKNNTSLAADEATRFATEIAKSLRFLGPDAQGSAAKVSGYVTLMAAKMKDVGGNGEDLVKVFNEMTKGTSQGFFLRGAARVNSPGEVGSIGGSKAAMQGIDQAIKTLVTAGPGSPAYSAQVESAAQILGTSTDAIQLWGKTIEAYNAPLNANQKLLQAWQQEMEASSASVRQIKDSIIALVQRGVEPWIKYINEALSLTAKAFQWAASSAYAYVPVTVLVAVGAVKTGVSLFKLAVAIARVGVAADLVAKKQLALSGIETESSMFGNLKLLRAHHALGIGARATMAMAPGMAAMAITSSAAAGYAVGTAINEALPDKWKEQLATLIGKAVYSESKYKAANVLPDDQRIPLGQMAERLARMAVNGTSTADVVAYAKTNAYRVEGLKTQASWDSLIAQYVAKTAQLRERKAQTAYDTDSEANRLRDANLIPHLIQIRDVLTAIAHSSDSVERTNKKRVLMADRAAARVEEIAAQQELDAATEHDAQWYSNIHNSIKSILPSSPF